MNDIYKVCRNIISVLTERRGYVACEDCSVTRYAQNYHDFCEKFNTNSSRSELVMKYRNVVTNKVIIVLFAIESNVGKQDMLSYVSKFTELNADEGILIIRQRLPGASSTAKKTVSSVAESVLGTLKFHIEVFEDKELVFNIFEHEDQPTFYVVPHEEHASIFATVAPADKLPRQKKDDIVSRLLGLRAGDILRTESVVETAGMQLEYRRVV